ncbi:MAG: putative peptidoglycan glycosyltransferase FtsW [Chlamydiales bacterium]|nr:putative peptidoglycan glycosyltransferase FtsW [Chlamydiales bacterium]
MTSARLATTSRLTLHRSLLLVASAGLFVLGLTMIFNTTSAEALDMARRANTHQALFRQIMYAILGCWLSLGAWFVGYHTVIRLSPLIFAVVTLLLLLVFIPGVGRVANGSHRWVGLAGLTVQPSEFAKYILPIYFIHRIGSRGEVMDFKEFVKLCLIIAVPLALVALAPDHDTVAVIGLSLALVCFISGIRWKYWALPMIVGGLLAGVVAVNTPYVAARLKVYMDPSLDLLGKGHQPYQAKIAAGSGQLFGKGPGQSLQKLSYLPEAQNDYIAAIYAEEFGFVGILLLIGLYMTIAYCGCYIAFQAQDREGCYMALAITFLISIQAFLNLGVVSGLLPSTGLNLPLFSQGGTSLLANLLGLGVLLSIGKNSAPISNKLFNGLQKKNRTF